MMVLLSFMPSTTIKAQFNTVGRLYNQQVHKTKNPQETNTSLVDQFDVKRFFEPCFITFKYGGIMPG